MCKQITKRGSPCKLPGKYDGYCYRHKQMNVDNYCDEEKTEDLCKICLDLLGRGKTMTTSCGCSFHKFCLERWYNINNTCPLHDEEQQGIQKPLDIVLKIEVTQTYGNEFTDNLIQKYIGKPIRSVTLIFEKYGGIITTIVWDKSFNKMLTKTYLIDLNKTCKKLRENGPKI